MTEYDGEGVREGVQEGVQEGEQKVAACDCCVTKGRERISTLGENSPRRNAEESPHL